MEHEESEEGSPDISFDNLYEAILQCFVIILSGYIAGRARIITSSQSAGIGNFVSKFCLPALLFQNMCKLNFSQVSSFVFFYLILRLPKSCHNISTYVLYHSICIRFILL